MKIRKTLVAAASALAIGVAGTGIANAAEADTTQADTGAQTSPSLANLSSSNSGTEGGDTQEDGGQQATSSSSDIENSTDLANEIKVWLGVVTAAIGVLGAIFGFVNKWF